MDRPYDSSDTKVAGLWLDNQGSIPSEGVTYFMSIRESMLMKPSCPRARPLIKIL